jgi:hypothetical protein
MALVMFRRMVRKGFAPAFAALSVILSGCDLGTRADAAKGVERFLSATQAGDRIGFEARIDRPSLREDLRRQMIEVARANGVEVDGGPSDRALDRMIGPEAFQLVEAHTGQALPEAPNAAQVAMLLKPLEKGRVCLHDITAEERCLLTFAKVQERWRLVGMQAMDLKIQVSREPPK